MKGFFSKDQNVVVVRFDNADQNTIVSPVFLIPLELTKFGEELLAASPNLLEVLTDIECRKDQV